MSGGEEEVVGCGAEEGSGAGAEAGAEGGATVVVVVVEAIVGIVVWCGVLVRLDLNEGLWLRVATAEGDVNTPRPEKFARCLVRESEVLSASLRPGAKQIDGSDLIR